MARASISENEVYKEKLKALEQYNKSQKESNYKERYEKAKKELEQREFRQSPLGRGLASGKSVADTFSKPTKIQRRQVSFIKSNINKPVQIEMSKGQLILNELFGGQNQTWGTGNNLPVINNALTSGGGLIKSGDNGRTRRMFGFV